MTKRFCDACGVEIQHFAIYYIEQIVAANLIFSESDLRKPGDCIVSKRDLCEKCSPKTSPVEHLPKGNRVATASEACLTTAEGGR